MGNNKKAFKKPSRSIKKAKNQAYAEGLVSIIMPNRNGARFLTEAIESVLVQSWKNWELIIIDDGSHDQSKDCIKFYAAQDKRIKTVFLKRPYSRAGLVRNEGIKKANGRYLAFLDSDDIWLAEKLTKQIKYMKQHKAAICTTHTQTIDLSGRILGAYTPKRKKVAWEDMLKENYVSTSATIVDRKKVENSRFLAYKYCQDYAFWMNFIKKGAPVHILPEKLTQYRIDPRFYIVKKIPKIYFRWKVHRKYLNRSFFQTLQDFITYAYTGYKKSQRYKNNKI